MKLKELSVFFPAYNEEDNAQTTLTKAVKILPLVAKKWEIIVVNDGSTDKTGEVVQQMIRKEPRIRMITHRVNQGYGGALKTGFRHAVYKWVAFTDFDGQFDFAEIEKFLPYTTNADLILGYRLSRADSFWRRLFTFGWSAIARLLLGLKARDYSCGFKLVKKKVFEAVQPLVGEEKVTQIEILIKARQKGFKFVEIGVHHYPRKFGKQTGADLRVVARSVVDLFKLRQKLKKTSK